MNRKKGIWAVLFLVIAAFSIWAVIAQCKDFSLENFKECVRNANPAWLAAALLCMMGFIVFEGLALQSIIKAFGYPRGWRKGFVYSSADIYFSAITPSATGGQPASGYFMMADGVPGAVVTVSLIVNLIMYTAAFLVVGAVCLVVRPKMYLGFHLPGRILIVVGYAILLGLGIMFYLRACGPRHGFSCKNPYSAPYQQKTKKPGENHAGIQGMYKNDCRTPENAVPGVYF